MKAKPINGKGSRRRPTNEKAFRDNFDNIFVSPLPIEKRPFEADPINHANRPCIGSGFLAQAARFARMFT